ncbi:unnamed protein product [Ixodes persulcatus]
MTGFLRTFVFLPGMSLSRDVVGLFSKFTLRMQKIQQGKCMWAKKIR